MKRLKTSDIAAGIRLPIKKGTLEFLQDSYKEVIGEAIIAMIDPVYNASVPYIIYGCNKSNAGGVTISKGAIFFNGEVYLHPSQTFAAPAGGNVVICNLLTTQYTTNADPVTFSDSVQRNVHNNVTASFTTGVSGSGAVGDYDNMIRINDWTAVGTSLSGLSPHPGTATFTSVTVDYQRFHVVGRKMTYNMAFTGTMAGSCTSFDVNIPPSLNTLGLKYKFAAYPMLVGSYQNFATGLIYPLYGYISSTSIAFSRGDGLSFVNGIGGYAISITIELNS